MSPELKAAEQATRRQYEWMVEKYVGRERFIPDCVPEMREYDRLLDVEAALRANEQTRDRTDSSDELEREV
jgi:hypothetical protein